MENYQICTQLISFDYLDKGEMKNVELEIILPDRAEFQNKLGLKFNIELQNIKTKKIKEIRFAWDKARLKLLPSNHLKTDQNLVEERLLKDYSISQVSATGEIVDSLSEERDTEFSEYLSEFTINLDSDYYDELYEILIKYVLEPNYPDVNWYSPTIPFKEIIDEYMREYEKYSNVFLATGRVQKAPTETQKITTK